MKPLIVMNWKMNPETLSEAIKLSILSDKKEFVLCPPFIFLSSIKNKLANAVLGAQDSFWEEKGAFTGEISASMLKKIGCKYVIIGHSEREKNLNENEIMIRNKLKAIINAEIIPIVCVGSEQRNEIKELEDIESQIKKIFLNIKLPISTKLIIVYEPIWAISTNKKSQAASPKRIENSIDFILATFVKLFGKNYLKQIRVLYGGSVNSKNISDFLKIKGISGVLVGAASLDKKEIQKISSL